MRRTKIERNILFLCKDNACLSLMAESMAKHRRMPKIRIFSAGIRPGKIPPEVRRVLTQVGYIPAENLVGRAEIIFFSSDGSAKLWEVWKWPSAIRWSRLFQSID